MVEERVTSTSISLSFPLPFPLPLPLTNKHTTPTNPRTRTTPPSTQKTKTNKKSLRAKEVYANVYAKETPKNSPPTSVQAARRNKATCVKKKTGMKKTNTSQKKKETTHPKNAAQKINLKPAKCSIYVPRPADKKEIARGRREEERKQGNIRGQVRKKRGFV